MPKNSAENVEASQPRRKRLAPADRRKAILAAAQTVFFQKGYTATSLDEIIKLGGGSRRSIYSEFGNKRGLFNALLADVSNSIYTILDALDSSPMTTAELLSRVGELLMEQLATTEYNFMRIAVMESLSSPEITRLYHENGPMKIEEKVAALLEEASDRDTVGIADCRVASRLFIGMLREEVYTRLLLQQQASPSIASILEAVPTLVRVVLHGLAHTRNPAQTLS